MSGGSHSSRPSAASIGGYPASMFVSNPFNNITCMICHEILRDPVHCPEDHHFCRRYQIHSVLKYTISCAIISLYRLLFVSISTYFIASIITYCTLLLQLFTRVARKDQTLSLVQYRLIYVWDTRVPRHEWSDQTAARKVLYHSMRWRRCKMLLLWGIYEEA